MSPFVSLRSFFWSLFGYAVRMDSAFEARPVSRLLLCRVCPTSTKDCWPIELLNFALLLPPKFEAMRDPLCHSITFLTLQVIGIALTCRHIHHPGACLTEMPLH
jgi:hypothetical protein